MKPLPPPLRYSIPAAILILGIIILLLSFYAEINSENRRVKEDRLNRTRFLGTLISGEIESYYRQGQPLRAQITISRASGDRDLLVAVLYNDQDRVISATRFGLNGNSIEETPFSRDAPILHKARDTLTPSVEVTSDGKRVIGVFPLFMEDSKIGKFPSQIGILAVAYDLHAATAIALHDALLRTLTLAATLGGICLLMGFFFNWALLQRVQHLVKISQQIAQSDFTARAKLHGSDELALLANAFNEMGSHLQIKTNALQDALKKLTEANELKDQLIIREKQARIDAEKSVQLRDDFLAIASHELRTPLTPLKMQVQLMQRHLQDITPTTFPKIGVLLNVIESTNQQLDRFLKLIEDLLDVSRISSEKLVLSLEETDLSLLISDEVMHLEKELLKAKCKVKLTIQPQVKGFFDRTRIKQVATTLLSNAMKYGAGKPIEVSVSSTKNGSQFSVRDYGIGIAKEDQNKIFGRFERVAPIKYFGGLGLGLYIASNIVIAHGGTIRFWSEPGAGTCFTVELPLQQKSS